MNTHTDILERIRAKSEVDDETDCEIYQGATSRKGYGLIYYNGKMHSVHRVVHEVRVGKIPPGFDVHHICGNRACCRVDHLQAIPHRLNVVLTREHTALRWERLNILVALNLDLNFVGVTHVTSSDLSILWGSKYLKGSNLSEYLETLKYLFKDDFKCKLVREGRGRRPHLYEIGMTPKLLRQVESYAENYSQSNSLEEALAKS